MQENIHPKAKYAFLCDEFFSLTLMAAVQRGNVYAVEASELVRKGFRFELQRKLEEMALGYSTLVAEELHLNNICLLADYVSKNHSPALKAGRFRIGTAQKALNLYLKYLWCVGAILEPPHCPFDFQIIKRLQGVDHIRWTKLDKIEQYEQLVIAAKKVANPLTVAQWELSAYNAIVWRSQEH
jgi:hypothetical protein